MQAHPVVRDILKGNPKLKAQAGEEALSKNSVAAASGARAWMTTQR